MVNAPIVEQQVEIGAAARSGCFCGSAINVAAEVFFEVPPVFNVRNDLSEIARALRRQQVPLKGHRFMNGPRLGLHQPADPIVVNDKKPVGVETSQISDKRRVTAIIG